MSPNHPIPNEIVAQVKEKMDAVRTEIAREVVGQENMIVRLLIGVLSGGHILLEGAPGLAKTTAIKALAQTMTGKFQRIQFTPDLLPSDLIGTMIYLPSDGTFQTRKGPIFANFVLADEINRAPSKVQSALLEAMQERQVTIGENTWTLDAPFFVMATQNPIEQEGTYPLPEAQVDRFMLKVKIGYPSLSEEKDIFDRCMSKKTERSNPVLSPEETLRFQEIAEQVYVAPSVRDYILSLVRATRNPSDYGIKNLSNIIEYGASPRASLCIGKGAKALALLSGRGYATPQDVKDVAAEALRHRVSLTYEAEADETTPDDVIERLLEIIPVP